MPDKIFFNGATGDIGSKLVNLLLKKNADIEFYARNAEKTRDLHLNASNLRLVEGDYFTTNVFEREIVEHNRLFILVRTSYQFTAYKVHRSGEERILAEKGDDQYYVALRPGHFLTSVFQLFGKLVKESQVFEVVDDLDHKNDYILTADIAELASIVLTELIKKYCDTVYTLIGESFSPNEVAGVLSDGLGKPIKAKKIPIQDRYNDLISRGIAHYSAFELVSLQDIGGLTPYFSIVLGRPPQTSHEWLQTDFDLSTLQ